MQILVTSRLVKFMRTNSVLAIKPVTSERQFIARMGKPLTMKSCETSLISPESPTAPENLHLAFSPVDLADTRTFTPVILLYDTLVESEIIVRYLKGSLQKVLVDYYPLAGRIAKGENGAVELRCDDSGAVFTEAVVETTLAEFGGRDACFQITGMAAANLRSEGFQVYTVEEYDEVPPLVIQVTFFKCKTVAVAVNWHHQVADGVSGFAFLKAWSEVARGLPISSPPDHRRHLLSARSPPRQVTPAPPEYRISTPQQPWHTQSRKKVEITLSRDEIQRLKAQGAPCTSGICISAHLWKLVTVSRNLPKDDTTYLFSVLDGRTRLTNFPTNYFGNCVFVKRTAASVGDVIGMSLRELAKRIHESVSEVTDEYLRSVLDWFEVVGTENVTHHRPAIETHDLQPTFWRFLPVYEVDFGFGTPRFGGRNSPAAGAAGFAAVSPAARDGDGDGGGGVVISVYLSPDAADALIASLV